MGQVCTVEKVGDISETKRVSFKNKRRTLRLESTATNASDISAVEASPRTPRSLLKGCLILKLKSY